MSISRPQSPLAAVTAALERAAELGELTPAELDWSLSRLSGLSRRSSGVEGGDRRQDVLRAATSVFLRRGYHHATLGEVAAELSLTKAGLYHYFGSKQEILEAICDQAMTAVEKVLTAGLALPGTAEDRLRRAAGRYLDLFLSDGSLTILVRHFDDLSERVRARMCRRRQRLEARTGRTLEEGVRQGVFDAADTHLAVLAVFGTINWTHSWYERDGRLSAVEVRDALVRQVLQGITAGR
jgi:TetR/AcrR family transcriptional regulator, cholesterol catabolism regulator